MAEGNRKVGVALKLVTLLVIAAIVYVGRPLFHPIIYRAAYSPGMLILGGGTILVAVGLFMFPRMGDDFVESVMTKGMALGAAFVILALIAGLYGIPASMFEERTIADQTMNDAEHVETFPAVNEDNPRIAPRAVSDVQTRGSVSYRQYRLGESDIARMEDGRLAWSYSVQPDDFRNKLYENQQGVLMSDMTRMENREMKAVDDHEFETGEGMWLHRGSDWNLKKTDYWAQYRDDPIEFTHNGTPYLAYPKTGHEWHLTPIPHTTPTWEGVALIHPDGTIEHLSPQEARDSEILEGQRLYPLYNTEREMKSLGYREGIINQMGVIGSHENEVEIASMPSGSHNSQPFVIDLEGERMSYVTALEPYGEDTRGLDEVWFADSRTGEYTYFGTGGDTLRGPERAMGIVRSSDTRTGWGDDFQVIEPVPVTIDGELWWHSKVVPTDNTDISRNVFVNAHTAEAVELHDTESVKDFMAGKDVEEVQEVEKEPAEEEEDVAYYVVIIGEDGNELDRIPIEPGQEVNIVQDDE